MDITLDEDLGGFLTEKSHVFRGRAVGAFDDVEEGLTDLEEGLLVSEIGNVETHRKALEMLEIMKAATPVGRGTEHPGQAREGWHIVRLTDGWSLVNDVPYVSDLIFGTAPHVITSSLHESPFGGGGSSLKPMAFHTVLSGNSLAFAMSVDHPGARPIKELRAAWDDAYVHGLVTSSELRRDFTEALPRAGIL